MAEKQKILAISGLFSGAIVWGVIWYPYRLLGEAGLSGSLSSFLTYLVAMALGLWLFPGMVGRMRHAGMLPLGIAISAGWTNLAYVLAVIEGEVVRVLLLFYLAPLWTVVFSRVLLRERLNGVGYGIVGLSLAGAVAMLWRPELGAPLPGNRAEWMALSAGMTFSLANVLTRKAHDLDIHLKSFSVWLGVSLLCLLPLLWEPALARPLVALPGSSWAWIVVVGVVIFAVTLAVQYGLSHTPANQAIVIFLFELVVAAISSYLLAREVMGLREWVGGAMIVAASLFSGKLEQNHDH